MPFCSVPKSNIGNRCIGNPAILHNQYIIFLSTQGKKLVQHATVCTFQFVCDIITRHQFQARNLPYRIWNIYNLLYVLSIYYPAACPFLPRFWLQNILQRKCETIAPHPFSGCIHTGIMIGQIPHLSTFYTNCFNKSAHIFSVSFLHIHFGPYCGM